MTYHAKSNLMIVTTNDKNIVCMKSCEVSQAAIQTLELMQQYHEIDFLTLEGHVMNRIVE